MIFNMILLNAAAPITSTANPTWLLVCIGAGGALALQLLLLLEQIKLPANKRPDYNKFIYYWPYIVNPLLGAFLVFVYVISQDFPLTPLLSFHIGASAPLIIRTMASAIPSDVQGSLQNPSKPD
jgi:hypothetical protein